MKAGIGIIRKNNFFYTKKGSYQYLEAFLIDQPLQSIYTATIDCTNCTFFHNGTQVSGEAMDNYFNVSGAYTDHITIH